MRLTAEHLAKIKEFLPIPRKKPGIEMMISSTQLCALSQTVANGARCRKSLAIGTPSIRGSIGGARTARSTVFSRRCKVVKTLLTYDKEIYKHRNEIERFFLRIKQFRKVFTRYDKLDVVYMNVFVLAIIFDAIIC